jgi:hypothetical protein
MPERSLELIRVPGRGSRNGTGLVKTKRLNEPRPFWASSHLPRFWSSPLLAIAMHVGDRGRRRAGFGPWEPL